MKAKRFISLALIFVFLSAGSALSAQPEDALTSRPEDSLYAVLKLDDTSAFLKWALSNDNINTFMPLILASENSNDIIGIIEMVSAIVQNSPLKSVAAAAGISGKDAKSAEPFFQAAFTVSPELNPVVRNISQGKADAKDIAKIILGADNPLTPFAETMIKVERGNDNILRIDNALFIKAVDDVIILGLSEDDIKASVNSLDDKKARLSAVTSRKFSTKDFAVLHIDYNVLEALDDTGEVKSADLKEIFVRPLNVELGFERQPDRFTISSHVNIKEVFSKVLAKTLTEAEKNLKPVKGGYIDLKNSGGSYVPMFAFGGLVNLSGAAENVPEAKTYFDFIFGQLRKRFGISQEEVTSLFTGPLSVVVNGSVLFESFRIPAVYISQTGEKGAASKVYSKLTKSPHFHKVHEGILQVDSSLSPVSCIIGNAGDTLGISFAELASFKDRPAQEGAFGELMKLESTSAAWIDFAGIQSWLNDDSNGVFAAITPLASLLGYGKILEAVRDVLNADLSVTSISIRTDDIETFHIDFSLKDIRAEDGLLPKLIKIYREFK